MKRQGKQRAYGKDSRNKPNSSHKTPEYHIRVGGENLFSHPLPAPTAEESAACGRRHCPGLLKT